jgi:hypothetical protein
MEIGFETKKLPIDYSYLAPDTSEIRVLLHMRGGGLALVLVLYL